MFGFFNGYHTKLKWIFAVITFFLLFFDGALFANMAGFLTKGQYHIMPMLLVIWFVYAVLFELDLDLPIYAWTLLAGLIYDFFYFGVIGGFTVGLPIMVWVSKQLRFYLSDSIVSLCMIIILSITALQIFTYVAAFIAGLDVGNAANYVVHTFAPSLALNVIVAIILYLPFRQLFRKLKEI
ncbi:rod shape-determining protein MreD [Periweissella fabalis]|uniref:Rod shape-determining protein MreD n=1 Tax=Periweissella fabalis TaxID=1070421 RepID=A0A7X6N2H6_9LACO|nr:rod shape-determining protein MreD [Periweissella fabalis]MCM0598831.1 rod shape-determining protein MreD [Periweissella fabalis]NKZ24493.1 rod shape-determining protein MreD [Periweissella fabalis]